MSFKLKYNIGKTEEPSEAIKYETVDLGLPSGTLWAKCNVGAKTETDYGLYFAWGETQGYTADEVGTKKSFAWSDYKFNPSGDGTTFTKYNATDGKSVLDIEDDAAYVNMGEGWKMPTHAQIEELFKVSNTNHEIVTKSGITGMEFTSIKNGNTLFIPLAGKYLTGKNGDVGSIGYLWSSTVLRLSIAGALCLTAETKNENVSTGNQGRYTGCSVRGV